MDWQQTRRHVVEHGRGHLRVTGPPASGKTTTLLQRFAALEAGGRRPVVLTYTRAAQDRLFAEILERNSGRFGARPIVTYGSLAADMLRSARRRPPLGEAEQLVALRRVIARKGILQSDLRSIRESESFLGGLLDVFGVLLQNDVGPDAARALADDASGARSADVFRCYHTFARELHDKQACTFHDAAHRARELFAEGLAPHPLADVDVVLIDDFHDLDGGQFALIAALFPPGGDVDVNVFGDPSGARFAFRGTSERFLVDEFPRVYRPGEVALPARADAPLAVRAALSSLVGVETKEVAAPSVPDLPLFKGSAQPSTAPSSPRCEAVLAEDDVAEAQYVADECARLLATGEYAPKDIAVVCRERPRHRGALTLAFRDRGVAFDDGSAPRYLLDILTDALLGLMDEGFDERLAETVMTSPLYDALRDVYREKLGLGERRFARDERELDRMVRFMRGGLVDKDSGNLAMGRFLDECVRPLVARAAGEIHDASLEAAPALGEGWSRYTGVVEMLGGRPSVNEFRGFVRLAAGRERTARRAGAVALYSAQEASTRSFPVVFVVGCADGIFPAGPSGDHYLPFADISRALERSRPGRAIRFHAGRSPEELLREESLLLATALTRARERLTLCAPEKFGGEEVVAPAVALAPAFAAAETRSTARRRAGTISGAAFEVAASDPGGWRGDDRPDGVRAASWWLAGPVAPRPFTVEPFALSPSRLERYVECPRRFFYDRVLGIDEDKSVNLTVGSLFHTLMEKVAAECTTRDEWVALADERVSELVEEEVAQSIDLGPDGSLVSTLARHFLIGMVREVRRLERQRVGEYEIGRAEAMSEFDYDGERFTGKIDRVDRHQLGAVVIDYKTGQGIKKRGSTIKKHMLDVDGNKPRHWQIPMYSHSVLSEDGRLPQLFCYYAVPPGEDAFVVGLFVGHDESAKKSDRVWEGMRKDVFDWVSPGELDALMREAAGHSREIFGERVSFPRTENVTTCRNCHFNRVCDRKQL